MIIQEIFKAPTLWLKALNIADIRSYIYIKIMYVVKERRKKKCAYEHS